MSSEGGKVSVCRESKKMENLHRWSNSPIYLTVRVHLWDGFLFVLTLGCDGEPEALRCWRELTLRKFEPSWSSVFKTYKIISIVSGWIRFSVVASMMLIAGVRHPSASLYLEISHATSLVLLDYILNMWLVDRRNQLMRREASYPSDHTHTADQPSWALAWPSLPVQTSVHQVIKTSHQSKLHQHDYYLGEPSINGIS